MKSGSELFEASIGAAKLKAAGSFSKLFILGILAGAFIAFAAAASNTAAFGLLANGDTYGVGRALAGAVFTPGLMLVIVAGAELFTGNTLMLGGVLRREVAIAKMLRNWLIVYIGNLVGGLFIAWLVSTTGLLHAGGDLLGAMTLKIAAGKTALSFGSAFSLGILCNWLVCLAVWMAWAADSVGGKMAAVFFPIWLFVTSGYEHSVANMYYIPAGLLAKNVPEYAAKAAELGVSSSAMDSLTVQGFFVSNLIPVTLGNIVGGSIFVALAYFVCYGRKERGSAKR